MLNYRSQWGKSSADCRHQRTLYILAFFTVVASSSNLSTLKFGCKGTNFRTKCKIIFKFLKRRLTSFPYVYKLEAPSWVASDKKSQNT